MTYARPNYTQTPNLLLDQHIKDMGEAELKVVLIAVRKTIGWHKERDMISLSQFQEATGMSRQGVINGINDAVKRGVLSKVRQGNSFSYSLVVNEVDQKVVNEVDTQKKVLKKHTADTKMSAEDQEYWDKKSQEANARPKAERKSKEELEAIALGIGKPDDGLTGYPVDVVDRLSIFFAYFPYLRDEAQKNKGNWIKQVRTGWKDYDNKALHAMCKFVKQEDWKVYQPSSINKAYIGMKAKGQQSKSVEDKLKEKRFGK